MEKQYETLLHQWFGEVWNEKREEAIDSMLLEETQHRGLGGAESEPVYGIENYKVFFRNFIAIFPDIHVTVEDVVTDGEKLAGRFTVRGTHTGDGLGIPPTNKQVEFGGIGICTIKDGKFADIWNEIDFMKMYSQLGVLNLNL